jgi:hypothetical protein
MINFKYKGIEVGATVEELCREYADPNRGKRKKLERHVVVSVSFWDYAITQERFTQLTFIKSVLQYYIQCYWKRSSKQGSKIDLNKAIKQLDLYKGEVMLIFTAKQKNSQYSLMLSVAHNGQVQREVYFDTQEVIMLHDAISKAINLLGPVIEPPVEHEYISKMNWGN